MLSILLILVAACLMFVTTSHEVRVRRSRWDRLAHATLGALAITFGCGTACVTTLLADEAPAAESPAVESIETESSTASSPTAESPAAAPAAEEPVIYTGPIYPADRPSWVTGSIQRSGDVHRVVVDSGPCTSRQECLAALDVALQKVTDAYIDDYLKVHGAASQLNVDLAEIHDSLENPDYVYGGTVEFSIGPMHEEFRMLEFTREFRERLDDRWRAVVARNRLIKTGAGAGGVLLLLTGVFGLLRSGSTSRTYYRGR